ncbi:CARBOXYPEPTIDASE [Salix koriyanagi]|uniref:Carboxypeptidase n=1 Tax=Salix koriyanagi TaxID=2511006 RepID=A0A9Q0P797_9ROSI|nr:CARBOXYPEPTIDASE [Salix koriyanagi]
MVGNFLELGPYRVVSDSEEQNITLQPNLGSWNRIFGLIFLDNPIGTGFSIASKHEEIPRDQNTVAKHLFYAITKFLESDPVFKTRSIYITGESYAGKYVPAIGHYILKKNMKLPVSKQVNLKGVAIDKRRELEEGQKGGSEVSQNGELERGNVCKKPGLEFIAKHDRASYSV